MKYSKVKGFLHEISLRFGVWLISYKSLHEIPQNKTRCNRFILVILTEMKFQLG